MSKINDLTNGPAKEAADIILFDTDVSVSDLKAGLINALNRIHRIEERLNANERGGPLLLGSESLQALQIK